MEREAEKHPHTIFHSINGLGEVKMNVWWQHRTVTLFFQLFALFFLFSQSCSLSFYLPPSLSLRECQHYNFIRVASFSLASYYAVCVFDKRTHTQANTSILNALTLSFTRCSFTSFYVSTDWCFAYVLLSLLVFPHSFLRHCVFFFFAPVLITSFQMRTSRAQIYTQFHSCPNSIRCLFISNENVNHLPFAHLKSFLEANPIACTIEKRDLLLLRLCCSAHFTILCHSFNRTNNYSYGCVLLRIHLMDARGGTHTHTPHAHNREREPEKEGNGNVEAIEWVIKKGWKSNEAHSAIEWMSWEEDDACIKSKHNKNPHTQKHIPYAKYMTHLCTTHYTLHTADV